MPRRLTTEEWIQKAIAKHGNKYNYSKVNYIGTYEKVTIICPKHGEFKQRANDHLSGYACPMCGREKVIHKNTMNTNGFIKKASTVHNGRYKYPNLHYKGYYEPIEIYCPQHGIFTQRPYVHLSGHGCPICSNNVLLTTREFIIRAQTKHQKKYDYSKVNYINTETKVCIICPEHGEFWQTPHHHLQGKGCPICNISKLETEIKTLLECEGIQYIAQAGKKELPWIGRQKLDFYLPTYNVAIECQGGQHFKPIKHFGGTKGYATITKRDIKKKNKCIENGLKILYYSNLGIKYPYQVIEDKQQLLCEIYKNEPSI